MKKKILIGIGADWRLDANAAVLGDINLWKIKMQTILSVSAPNHGQIYSFQTGT